MDIQQSQFWVIELIAYWEGRLTTTHLRELLGISRQHASSAINRYREEHPGNLRPYRHGDRAHLASDQFERHYISGDAAEYLSRMAGVINHNTSRLRGYGISSLVLSHPPRNVSPSVMRPLVHAMREQRRVEVDYGSIANPNREGRIIVPHTFVNTGLRWHLRAWCEKNQGYRDFVLSRFHGQPEVLDTSPHGADDDTAWNTEITLILEPDMRLSTEQKMVLEHDYGMENGKLHLKTKAALASYLLKEMQVHTKILDGRPEAQQLVLVNYDDVKEWIF